MLLKFSTNSNERSSFNNGKGKAAKVTSRIHRKTLRIASKPGKKAPGKKISFGKNQKNFQASRNFPPTTTSLCDNSNDSGLGFDESHHHHHPTLALTSNNNNNSSSVNYRPLSTLRYSDVINTPPCTVTTTTQDVKRPTPIAAGKKVKSVAKPSTSSKVNKNLTLSTENEDTCNSDDFSSFYQTNAGDCKSNSGAASPLEENYYQSSSEKRSSTSGSEGSSPITSSGESPSPSAPDNIETLLSSSLHKQFTHVSREGTAQLQIITQPEQQHRARYQTEGSRGAVKDRSGNGFPVVKLNGYNKPTTLQVFIGNDVGRVSPHIFYQACKVSGKNSTPCYETKTEGTMVIEIELKPENDMTVICDCVGILKERNVDVEHRLGRNHSLAASVTRNKKKSTKCRMIFRTKVNDDSDFPEILQICSNTITCTQPPGVPEICKKSLDTCSVIGGQELFIVGKNFLKDTKVTFVRFDESRQPKKLWEETVLPDKEYLQQTHLICVVPSYPNGDAVNEPVHVQIYVTSSNKKSEAHNFCYVPLKKSRSMPHSPVSCDSGGLLFSSAQDTSASAQKIQNVLSIGWNESSADNMMPPPLIMPRKASFSKNLPDTSPNEAPITLKTEFIDQTVINDVSQQIVATSCIAGLQPVFGENGIIDVAGMQNAFTASSQVQNILDVLSSNVAIQPEQLVNSAPNINILNSAISPSMMCEPNLMGAVQMVQNEMNSMGSPIENSSNVIVSNAVSDATAETQAVVKQMIAQAAAEMLSESENAAKTHSTISTFISNILPAPEQQQIPSSHQLQEMLNAATSSLMQEVKKDETIVQQAQAVAQGSLVNAAPPTTASTTTITQPFSPTTQDLTAMSESDLISFINPSVFM